MKKRILYAIALFCSVTGLYAARFTVYNDNNNGKALVVQLTNAKNQIVKMNILRPGQPIVYNTYGWSSFGALLWRDSLGDDAERNLIVTQNKPRYVLDVRSPGDMLTGSVHIKSDGSFAKNFSPEKVGIPTGGGCMGVHYGTLMLK